MGTGNFFTRPVFCFRKSCLSPFLLLCVLLLLSCASSPKGRNIYLTESDTLERPYAEIGPIEVRETLHEGQGIGGLFLAVVTLGAQDETFDSSKARIKFKKKMYAKLSEAAAKKGADAVYRLEFEYEHPPVTIFPTKRGYAKARGMMVKYESSTSKTQ